MNRPPPTVMSTATLTNSSTYVEKLMIGLDHAPAAYVFSVDDIYSKLIIGIKIVKSISNDHNLCFVQISNEFSFLSNVLIFSFELRTQIIGVGGANLIYIRNETGAVATLRGKGSLFIDPALGVESQEPMHLYIEHTRLDALQNAKQLARNLIETLQQELAHFQQLNPPGPAQTPTSVQSIQYTQQPVQNMQATHTQVSTVKSFT